MSRLQAIENALIAINETVFQELCDSFLALRNSNYKAFSRTGSQSGKQKTIKGTPDTFLMLPNGKYLFVEYSTNTTAGISKLKDDIKKCIDSDKTGIAIQQISEIILCINFNLKANQVEELKKLLSETYILLTIYSLDALSIELQLNHRDLTSEYLGLPFDTGQIVSIEKFIDEYNRASKGISTPLDNTFLHREQEMVELKDSLITNDFIILTGAPGVGKTKLAIEGLKKFLSENLTYSAYCISYKNHTLLEDLFQYLDSKKDYILFVDDANRIDAFNQITGFYKATRQGKLKIIITVRDYAYQDIGIHCQEFFPKRIDISKLTDEQIIDIIKAKPFEILNPDYHKEIVRIADGNPRLAIMTSLLSIEKQNIHALADVSDLFESYFSTFIKDDGEFAKELNIRCLGLIAFFYTIPYKDRLITEPILNQFDLQYDLFIETIDKLDKLELVEIQFEHVKVPEQNLATYFFYKAFIQDNLLSFETLLNNYFESNSNRFKDCVIPANNTFGYQNVMQTLKPFLNNYWTQIKGNEESGFKFLSTFWYYLQNESFEFIYSLTEKLPINESQKEFNVKYETNDFSYGKNRILELLANFFRFHNNLKDALELAFDYTRKLPAHLPELIYNIRESLTFDREDEWNNYSRQDILQNSLIEGVNSNDKLVTALFFELSKTFLAFKFHQTKSGRNHTIIFYDYPIPNNRVIQEFRKKIWNTLNDCFNFYPDKCFDVLKSYAQVNPDVSKEIMEFDISFLLDIINEHLDSTSFEHCKYVQDQVRWCKRNDVSHPKFQSLLQKFRNNLYEMFLKLDWDRFRDKESYEFDDHREYERLKEEEIRNSFILTNKEDVDKFYNNFILLKNSSDNDWNYNNNLDFIIDENCSEDFNIGCQLLNKVIESNNSIGFVPRLSFRNHLITSGKSKMIWGIIQSTTFKHKALWELSYYDFLSESLFDVSHVESILKTVREMNESNTIHLDRLERYLKIDPELFPKVLKIIVNKNEIQEVGLRVWMDFFDTHFDKLGNDICLIEKAYLQQDKIQNHFDYEGKGLLRILQQDSGFLLKYVSSLFSKRELGFRRGHRKLDFVWEIENIEQLLKDVFNYVIEKELYVGIRNHFGNSFFSNLKDNNKEKAKKFLIDYCKESYSDYKKMNVIVDIVRHSMKELYEEILLLFISLSQDVEVFSRIWWRGNGGTYSGDVIIGDIEAADWRNILSIVDKSEIGTKLIPIKKYINDKIESSLRSGDWERQRRFLQRY
ncbi:hypothetical protein [uncultured Draconibacterium sp.]|uniref:nSTAND3 domain-containing NTPase n=1 Tax=uncultured Draconibacterium sp. TaxID=1573823 RepID=UPI002AA90193|nr:hypothetical protein [uncultured Draconibacterium sp.]